MRSIARMGAAALAALAIAPAAAHAETFKTTFGGGAPDTFAWEGMTTGLVSIPLVIRNGCGTDPQTGGMIFRCDLVVFDVKEAGELQASVTMDDAPMCDPVENAVCNIDIDIYLFKSDAEGTRAEDATPVADSATAGQTEALKAKVQPGFYVLEVEPYQGQNVSYKGTSKFVSSAPAAPPAPPATDTPPPAPEQPQQQQPQQQQPQQPAQPQEKPAKKKTGKRAACQKKAKKIKNAKKRKKALKACKKKPV